MTVEAVRESTDAELDAKMLRELRVLPFELRKHGRDSVTVTVEELDLLLRVADERDELRGQACADPDPKYVVRQCADCHHEPHGIRMLCNNQFCGCRNEGRTR